MKDATNKNPLRKSLRKCIRVNVVVVAINLTVWQTMRIVLTVFKYVEHKV